MRNLFLLLILMTSASQSQTLSGIVSGNGAPLNKARITVKNLPDTFTDASGNYSITLKDVNEVQLEVSHKDYLPQSKKIAIDSINTAFNFDLKLKNSLDEVVISGTMKPVSRVESAVPVEIYKPTFFKKNPTSNIFEALQNVNGVRPQLNCNVCNTGDIHINGLEGPYTLVLIDGMPIVSGLSTVYGLSGIPNSLLERIEIVKGPASSLYGSEAVGGLINIITKNPQTAPVFSADVFSTSWGEANVDLGFKARVKRVSMLLGANYFNYTNPIDNNNDNFTDVTLQQRISVFQKWSMTRPNDKLFSIAARFFYEDRWGGEMQWEKKFRGGSEVYGESIYTKREEFLAAYDLPFIEKIRFSLSYTSHDQNSVYGNIPYLAQQQIAFGQLIWDKKLKHHDVLAGTAVRYQYYNDNTTATVLAESNTTPGIFIQDEISISQKHKLLLGLRYDYNVNHGNIITPRVAYKWKPNDRNIFRVNAGTGFRVVNLFTEEHAALTGSRDVVILEELQPERSYNINLNYLKKLHLKDGTFIGLELAAWYTYFTNSIVPDYDSDPDKIIYKNLDGYAITKGISANLDVIHGSGFKVIIGGSLMDVSKTEHGRTTGQILTEKFSGTWAISYKNPEWLFDIDYTGNVYGPMRLPILGQLDPRREYSRTWSIQNIQFTYSKIPNLEIYAGIKNLLDWTPNKGNPFIIARANDPFDQNVQYDANGNAVATPENPYALTFDPSYVYGPNQGIRTFMGIRYHLK